MKLSNVVLLCSVSFAGGMLVPFVFLEMNSGKSRTGDAEISSIATPKTQQILARRPLPSLKTPDAEPETLRANEATTGAGAPAEPEAIGAGEAPSLRNGEIETVGVEKSFDGLNPDADAAPAEDVVSASDDMLIGVIQTELLIRGYDPGGVVGKLGPGTRSAIKALQRDQGLPETGKIDEAVIETLDIRLAAESLGGANKLGLAEPSSDTEAELRRIAPEATEQRPGAPTPLNSYRQ